MYILLCVYIYVCLYNISDIFKGKSSYSVTHLNLSQSHHLCTFTV